MIIINSSSRFIYLFFILITLGCSETDSAVADSTKTTYYVIRHAEKLSQPATNPALSPQGVQRAGHLRDSLSTKGIDTIFVSEFIRTQQTAEPLATHLGITPSQYATGNISALIASLKTITGKDVLVVSHGMLVEQIVQGLSGHSVGPLTESTYDSMYVVTIDKSLTTTLERKTYGAH